MRINVAVPEPHVSAPILNAALEGVTRLDEDLIKSGAVPPFELMINNVRWKPEPPGQEHFDHAAKVAARGWGDCDDLGPWHAASLRVTGEDPGARAMVRKSGPKRWHVIVKRSDGSIDDPSIEAGMPGPGRKVGIRGATQPPMFIRPQSSVSGVYIATPHLALRPLQDRHGRPEAWQARTDLPWHWQPGRSASDVAMVSLHKSPISDQALVGACHGAIRLGEASGFAHDDHLDRIAAIRDALEGASWEELADEYGSEHATAAGHVVGSFFGSIFKGISKGISKIAPTALSFVPGVGPAASLAFKAASPLVKKLVSKRHHLPPRQRHAAVPSHRHRIVFTGPPIY